MRGIALVATAAVSLAIAAPADAAFNRYTATYAFTSRTAGTAKQPRPTSFTETIHAKSTTPGDRAGVLLDTTNVLYGVKFDGKDFPTCTIAEISAAQSDTSCPRRAKVASGYIDSILGSSSNFASAGQACDPAVDIWNAGQGKLAVFFVTNSQHRCLGGQLHTGGVPPFPATYKMQGRYLEINNPVPSSVTFPLGQAGGLVGSLQAEHLVWASQTVTVNGEKVASISSDACQGTSRPYRTRFLSTLPTAGPATETTTIRGSARC